MEDVVNQTQQQNYYFYNLNYLDVKRTLEDPKELSKEGIHELTEQLSNIHLAQIQSSNELIRLSETIRFHSNSISDAALSLSESQELILSKLFDNEKSALIQSISTIPEGSYPLSITSGVIAAIASALAALIFNYLYRKHIEKLNKRAHFSKVSLSHIRELESYCVEYWSNQKNRRNRHKMVILESNIKAKYTVLDAAIQSFLKTESCKSTEDIVRKFIDEIYELATGEDFEMHERNRNLDIAKKIASRCSRLESLLIPHTFSEA